MANANDATVLDSAGEVYYNVAGLQLFWPQSQRLSVRSVGRSTVVGVAGLTLIGIPALDKSVTFGRKASVGPYDQWFKDVSGVRYINLSRLCPVVGCQVRLDHATVTVSNFTLPGHALTESPLGATSVLNEQHPFDLEIQQSLEPTYDGTLLNIQARAQGRASTAGLTMYGLVRATSQATIRDAVLLSTTLLPPDPPGSPPRPSNCTSAGSTLTCSFSLDLVEPDVQFVAIAVGKAQ